MALNIRVRLLRTIAVFDGQTSIVVLAGTTGTAVCVNSPKKPENPHAKPASIRVYWDAVLLNDESDTEVGDYVAADWEDPEVDITDVAFAELVTVGEV